MASGGFRSLVGRPVGGLSGTAAPTQPGGFRSLFGRWMFGLSGSTTPPPPPPPPAVGGDDYPYYGYAKGERKRRGLEWRKKPDLADKLHAAYTELRQEAPPEIRAEVSEAVRPYVETSSDQALPPIAALDWSALLESLQAVQAILAAYEEMLDDEDQAIATLLL